MFSQTPTKDVQTLQARVGIKKPTQKTHPKKPQKTT